MIFPTSSLFLFFLLSSVQGTSGCQKTPTVSTSHDLPAADAEFAFGPATVFGSAVFYRTQLSLAFVNKNPVVAGHVLVIPVRQVARLKDLAREEVTDLFLAVQKVAEFVEEFYNGTANTVSINDGKDAGQTIPHVHVHVLQRRKEDFESKDEVYEKLQSHEKGEVKWRDVSEMAEEAQKYRDAWTE